MFAFIAQYRLAAEIIAGALLLSAIIALWISHNHSLINQGFTACEQKTTVTVDEAMADVRTETLQTQVNLSAVVETYEQKLRDMSAGNADLAQRLRTANPLRALPVRAVPGDAGKACACATDDSGLTEHYQRDAANLVACAANTIQLTQIQAAWNAARKKAGD